MDATSGHPPPQEKWGPIGAHEFLQVVHDIATWALENLECYSTRCPAELVYLDYAPVLPPIFYLSPMPMSPRGTHQPYRPLRRRIDPAERRNALWLVHALLAADHPVSAAVEFGTSRSERQSRILQGQGPAGIAWLVARMQHWPVKYRKRCWIDREQLSSLCRKGSNAAVN
jgi:hypothetical protein